MRPPPNLEFFAACAPGLEPVLHEEVRALRLGGVERQVGGVRFTGPMRDAWRANLHLRTTSRVLLRVARFAAADEEALYRGAADVEWSRFLPERGTLAVEAHSVRSRLSHTLHVARKVKDAVVDQVRTATGHRTAVRKEDPDLLVHAHLYRDRCTLLVDTSGDSLHRRGWRRWQGPAPLAETLAAGIVQLAGWDRRSPFLDPFCGSGTLLVEAGLLASGAAPGLFRARFAFERWPDHDPAGWQALREEARARRAFPPRLIMKGWDRDPAAVAGARENLEAAGLAGSVEVEVGEVNDFRPRRGWNAWVVTNPPYGERMGQEEELLPVYRRFGQILRERCGGYVAAVLCGNPRLSRALGLEPAHSVPLRNGPLECELRLLELPR